MPFHPDSTSVQMATRRCLKGVWLREQAWVLIEDGWVPNGQAYGGHEIYDLSEGPFPTLDFGGELG